jgi:hypothetical protein
LGCEAAIGECVSWSAAACKLCRAYWLVAADGGISTEERADIGRSLEHLRKPLTTLGPTCGCPVIDAQVGFATWSSSPRHAGALYRSSVRAGVATQREP